MHWLESQSSLKIAVGEVTKIWKCQRVCAAKGSVCIMQFWKAALLLALGMNCLVQGEQFHRSAKQTLFLYKPSPPKKRKRKGKKKRKISTTSAEERAACALWRNEEKVCSPAQEIHGLRFTKSHPATSAPALLMQCSRQEGSSLPSLQPDAVPGGHDALPAGAGGPAAPPRRRPAALAGAEPPQPRVPIPPRRERPAGAQGGHTHTHGGAGKVSCPNSFSSWASPQRRRHRARTRVGVLGKGARRQGTPASAAATPPPASPFRLPRKAAALRRRAPGLASADPRARPPPLPRPAGRGDTPHRPPAPAARYSRRPPHRRSRLYPMQPPAASAPARGL